MSTPLVPVTVDAPGPIEDVSFCDWTWQDSPELTDDNLWVGTDADFAYEGPPWPGFVIAMIVPAGQSSRIQVGDMAPSRRLQIVFDSEITVSSHG